MTIPAAELRARQPLALRLALLLAAAVAIVLLVAGLVVNRAVTTSFEEQLNAQQRSRLEFAAGTLGDVQGRAITQTLLRRVATAVGGRARLLDPTGQLVAEAGSVPANAPTDKLTQPVSGAARSGTLVVEVAARAPERAFLGVFNVTLVLSGLVAVLVLLGLAGLLSERLTRPLRGVAAAARRLGAGDLSARARGGADRESAELAAAFNGMAERLERSEMLRRRAASDMAHDLATPATVLESQLQAMIDGVVPADREQLEAARTAAGTLASVIGDLGDLASAEAAPLQRRAERIALADIVRDLERGLDALCRPRGIRLEVAVPADLGVVADPSQLSRVLRNVMTNAVQHSPEGGLVRVAAAARDDVAEIRFSDQGPGIAAADVPHLFERFYRADPSRTRTGSGIGLTIARELLAASGGTIGVERTGPDGTTFLVTLPLSAAAS